MTDTFKEILVPVDFSRDSVVAIEKALEYSCHRSVIHLLQVRTTFIPGIPSIAGLALLRTGYFYDHRICRDQMVHLSNTINKRNPDIVVKTWSHTSDSVQKTIEAKATELKADLIVVGIKSRLTLVSRFFQTLSPSGIARNTGIPVLCVKLGSLHHQLKTVMLPFKTDAPLNRVRIMEVVKIKLNAIKKLREISEFKLHLVLFSLNNDTTALSASTIFDVYQWLKSQINCNLEYSIIHGKNRKRLLVNYAQKIHADILLVDPAHEANESWINRDYMDFLPDTSKLQILEV